MNKLLNRSLLAALLIVACGDSSGGNTKGGGTTAGQSDSDAGANGDQSDGNGVEGHTTTTGGNHQPSTGDGNGTTGSDDAGVTPPRAGGIGLPCAVDSECPDGLVCHQDTDNFVAHGQCTVACSSTDMCNQQFDGTMCIGAEVCTLRCITDDDCPDQTICIEAGWCSRQGPGSGNPYCTGFADSCTGRSSTTCLSSLGCIDDSNCDGVSTSCYSEFDSYSCDTQDGCYWSSSSDDCSGSSWGCYDYSDSFSCNDQDGCYWSESCTGTPVDCDTLTVGACTYQPGCQVVTE